MKLAKCKRIYLRSTKRIRQSSPFIWRCFSCVAIISLPPSAYHLSSVSESLCRVLKILARGSVLKLAQLISRHVKNRFTCRECPWRRLRFEVGFPSSEAWRHQARRRVDPKRSQNVKWKLMTVLTITSKWSIKWSFINHSLIIHWPTITVQNFFLPISCVFDNRECFCI